MIQCEFCKKTHRLPEAVEKCKNRAARRENQAKKKAEDRERRIANWKQEPPGERIARRRGEGTAWEMIVSDLKKNYPPPEDGDMWTIYDVVGLYAERLNWPVDVETRTLMLLEKHYLGDYSTAHPLELLGVLPKLRELGARPIKSLFPDPEPEVQDAE